MKSWVPRKSRLHNNNGRYSCKKNSHGRLSKYMQQQERVHGDGNNEEIKICMDTYSQKYKIIFQKISLLYLQNNNPSHNYIFFLANVRLNFLVTWNDGNHMVITDTCSNDCNSQHHFHSALITVVRDCNNIIFDAVRIHSYKHRNILMHCVFRLY